MNKKIIVLLLMLISLIGFWGIIDTKTKRTNNVLPSVGGDSNLSARTLDLSYQNLSKLPDYVFEMKNLEELNISNNNLEGALPSQIGQNQNLKVLNAANNNMTGIPAEIGQLEKLEKISYAENEITGLPNELANLKNLKEIDLRGNDYSEEDMQKIKEELPDLKVIEKEIVEEILSLEEDDDEIKKPVEPKINCDTGSFNQQFLCTINKYRESKSLSKVSLDAALSNVAMNHSKWMNDTNIFSHTGKDSSTFATRCSSAGVICNAENLAAGAKTAEQLFDMWKTSANHNANMLGSHKTIGLAQFGKYITLVFN